MHRENRLVGRGRHSLPMRSRLAGQWGRRRRAPTAGARVHVPGAFGAVWENSTFPWRRRRGVSAGAAAANKGHGVRTERWR